ncbi:MAG: hypothetical protein ACP5GJ_03865 [Nanopusillaceae archaeon]|jgi:hypothetical protein
MIRDFFKRFVYLFVLIFGFILISHNIHSAETTVSYNFNIAAQNDYLMINYSYQGYNSFCSPITQFGCGTGLFFRVFVYNQQGQQIEAFRTGQNGCITDLSSTICDIPYSFNNVPISGSDTVPLNLQPGTYTIKVDFVVDLAWSSDYTLGTQTITYTLQPQQITPPQQNQTLYSSPTFTITAAGPIVIPQNVQVGQYINVSIPIQVKSSSNQNVVFWVTIKNQNGQQVLSELAGPSGTSGAPTNVFGSYYSSTVPGTYSITANVPEVLNLSLVFLPSSQGSYYVYIWPMTTTINTGVLGTTLSPLTTDPVLIGTFNVTTQVQTPPTGTVLVNNGQVLMELGNITISPNPGSVGQTIYITFPVYVEVYSGGAYGPDLYIYIENVQGQQVAFYRLGSQGYTTDSSVNYYFPNTPQDVLQFYNITVPFVPSQPGTYYIYALPKYDIQDLPDQNLGSQTLVAAFTVNTSQTSTGICATGQPTLVETAWMQNGAVITTAGVGQSITAFAEFTNPSTCTYVGSVAITIYTPGLFGPSQYATYTTSINLPPGKTTNVTYQVTFPNSGTYYFGVAYQIPSYTYTYKPQDVQTIEGTPSSAAGPELTVKSQPAVSYSVSSYYFMQNGMQTTKLLEGQTAEACAVITSNVQSQAQVTLDVYSNNVLGLQMSGGPFGNLWSVQQGIYTIIPNGTVICANFTPSQTSALHPNCWYMIVYVNGQNLGTYPPDQQGACIITQQQYIQANVQLLSSGWYTSSGIQVTKGSWSTGIYYVNATFANLGSVAASVPVEIDIDTPGGFFGLLSPTTIQKCSDVLQITPNSTASFSCSANLGDGQYYYVILENGKTVQTGPTITVGFLEYVKQFFNRILTAVGVSGIIMLVLFIFFGPYIIRGLIWMFEAWKNTAESIKEILQKIKKK